MCSSSAMSGKELLSSQERKLHSLAQVGGGFTPLCMCCCTAPVDGGAVPPSIQCYIFDSTSTSFSVLLGTVAHPSKGMSSFCVPGAGEHLPLQKHCLQWHPRDDGCCPAKDRQSRVLRVPGGPVGEETTPSGGGEPKSGRNVAQHHQPGHRVARVVVQAAASLSALGEYDPCDPKPLTLAGHISCTALISCLWFFVFFLLFLLFDEWGTEPPLAP